MTKGNEPAARRLRSRPRSSAGDASEPPRDCALCPRLAEYRRRLCCEHPNWHNAPVPTFAAAGARLLVVGLAPGKGGANRTGRVFTGDHAGAILYPVLLEFGFAIGEYAERADDALQLRDCAITNALACVPPQNKPTAAEIAACRQWLAKRIAAMEHLRAIVALGRIAHESVLRVFGASHGQIPFKHGGRHFFQGGVCLFSSYHCSRYNMNTGRLRVEMLRSVFAAARAHVDAKAEAGRCPETP